MSRPDDFPDPTDPTNLDPVDQQQLVAPSAYLAHHPYVRHLKREIKALRETVARMAETQREMFNRALVAGRYLEPLNPLPYGTVLTPEAGQPILIHVDNLRLMANRITGARDPTVRIFPSPGAAPRHCHELQLLGPSALTERYHVPLPGRSAAIVVLATDAPVEVLR